MGNKKQIKNIRFPINSKRENLQNKKIDYKTLAIMTLYSNVTPIEMQEDQAAYELYRYLYENKLLKNMSEIEELSGNKKNTIMKNIKKLSRLKEGMVIATNTPNGICYYIEYRSSEGGDFVTIEDDILKFLINVSNSNVIKTYIFLKFMCKDGAKEIHRQTIAANIGLSTNSKSLKTISDITFALERFGLIKKVNKYKSILLENGKRQYTQMNMYELCSYKEWKDLKNKRTSK